MPLLVPILILLAVQVAVLLLVHQCRIVRREQPPTCDADWLSQVPANRYRPMLRLLDGRDIALMRLQPGFTPDMAARMRRQRAQIFGRYLDSLQTDFRCLTHTIKLILIQSEEDRPELARMLVRIEILFALGMALIRLRLVLYRCNLMTVEASPLVRMFEYLRTKLTALSPAEDPAVPA